MKWRVESSLTKDEEQILASLLPEADLAAQLGVTVRTTRFAILSLTIVIVAIVRCFLESK